MCGRKAGDDSPEAIGEKWTNVVGCRSNLEQRVIIV